MSESIEGAITEETSILNVPAVIRIERPEGCDRKALSIHALDSRTRALAWQTYLYVEDADGDHSPLLCESFKVLDNGNLLVEVKPECFRLV